MLIQVAVTPTPVAGKYASLIKEAVKVATAPAPAPKPAVVATPAPAPKPAPAPVVSAAKPGSVAQNPGSVAASAAKPATTLTAKPATTPAPIGRYDASGNYIGASSPISLPGGGGMSAQMAAAIKANPSAFPGYADPSTGKNTYGASKASSFSNTPTYRW